MDKSVERRYSSKKEGTVEKIEEEKGAEHSNDW